MWRLVYKNPPPEEVILKTRRIDPRGTHIKADLIKSGNNWKYPDGSLYIFLPPTYWWDAMPKSEFKSIKKEEILLQMVFETFGRKFMKKFEEEADKRMMNEEHTILKAPWRRKQKSW